MGFLRLVEARLSRWRTGPRWPGRRGLCSTGLQFSAAPSSLSLLVQEMEPRGPLGLCPLPLKGGGGPRTGHGDPSCPLIGRKEEWSGGELSPPQASCYGHWGWGGEGSPRSPRTPGSQSVEARARRGKEGCLTTSRKLPLSCPGRKPVVLVWTGACQPSLGALLKKRLQSRKWKEETKRPCQGTRGLAPMWHRLPKLGACNFSSVG